MMYLLLSAVSAYLGVCVHLGASTFLRPLLDAVSPLPPDSVSVLCTMAALSAALVCAFFALGQPLSLEQDELISLAAGSVLGGVLGDLISARFMAMLPDGGAILLQNGLFFTIVALPAVYFGVLSRSIRPFALPRITAGVPALFIGLIASFLSFGAQPLSLAAYDLFFDADENEASSAALTIALCAMVGKLVVLLIRRRFSLPDADALLWLLPGAILGTLAAMIPAFRKNNPRITGAVIAMSLFAALINIASVLIR